MKTQLTVSQMKNAPVELVLEASNYYKALKYEVVDFYLSHKKEAKEPFFFFSTILEGERKLMFTSIKDIEILKKGAGKSLAYTIALETVEKNIDGSSIIILHDDEVTPDDVKMTVFKIGFETQGKEISKFVIGALAD